MENVTQDIGENKPIDPQSLTKVERLELLVEYAKSLGFTQAAAIWWDDACPEYGQESPFETADPYGVRTFRFGVHICEDVYVVWPENEDGDIEEQIVETEEEAKRIVAESIARRDAED